MLASLFLLSPVSASTSVSTESTIRSEETAVNEITSAISAPIAKVSSFSGNVKVLNGAKESRHLDVSMPLTSGDQVVTGYNGHALLKMKDGSTFSVRPNSLIPIESHLSGKEPVGKVLFVHGKVIVISTDDLYRQTIKGGNIYQGDIITTATASSLQLDMVDGGYFAIRPNSEIKINEYVYQKKSTDRVSTTLLKGGLRSITGAIGQANKKSFVLNTPIATVGIRGTDLVAFYLSDPDAALKAEQTGTAVQSGSYLKVQSGEALLATEAGIQPVKPNEIAFTASETAAPAPLTAEYAFALFEEETYEQPIPSKNVSLNIPIKDQWDWGIFE
ncbi:FecR domain-containing protein [Oceanospirillum maris]|uniref:FecR domain-containing protein n=1 Tax=Oceanospirillum maris TaxID=64977 RepID=UPI00048135CC|nr:FecR domain-containing protein [Oceanospirillum maris]